MKKILVLTEGQTEERFVKDVLCPECLHYQVYLQPVVLATKRAKTGNKFRGGVSTYGKIRNDALKLLGDTGAAAVTTFIDYYGLPADFPGRRELPVGSCYRKVEHLERCFADDINDQRFVPFLMLHEFETLLFADIEVMSEAFHSNETKFSKLKSILQSYNNIEEINDGSDTHPSRRIQSVFDDYHKALHGPLITGRIGMEKIRAACGHFNDWLKKLEQIATAN
ncbi:MAG: DUF4276 family protein [Acidobacteria bacterium]|nr:DUF4276 family protein [Acidobacteriota bacterium]